MKKLQNMIQTVVSLIRVVVEILTDLPATVTNAETRYDETGFGIKTCDTKRVRFLSGKTLTIVTTIDDDARADVHYVLTNARGRIRAFSEYHGNTEDLYDMEAEVKAYDIFGRKYKKYLTAVGQLSA